MLCSQQIKDLVPHVTCEMMHKSLPVITKVARMRIRWIKNSLICYELVIERKSYSSVEYFQEVVGFYIVYSFSFTAVTRGCRVVSWQIHLWQTTCLRWGLFWQIWELLNLLALHSTSTVVRYNYSSAYLPFVCIDNSMSINQRCLLFMNAVGEVKCEWKGQKFSSICSSKTRHPLAT